VGTHHLGAAMSHEGPPWPPPAYTRLDESIAALAEFILNPPTTPIIPTKENTTVSNVKLNPAFIDLVDGIQADPAEWVGHRIQILDDKNNVVEGCDITNRPTIALTISGTVQVPFTVEVVVEEGDWYYDQISDWVDEGADLYKADDIIRDYLDAEIEIDEQSPNLDSLEIEDLDYEHL